MGICEGQIRICSEILHMIHVRGVVRVWILRESIGCVGDGCGEDRPAVLITGLFLYLESRWVCERARFRSALKFYI